VLPLAISFFTFQQIAFLVDAYRGFVEERSFLRYCLFITFFPQLIAGPILHHAEMMPQFGKQNLDRQQRLQNIAVGLTIFTIGLMKKTIIADYAGRYADIFFAQAEGGEALGFIGGWMAATAYCLQIYFDFSGYADMATGLARMLGIVLPQNFNSPYKSTNIIAFWRRWHMTLSRFFRDYLYLPLGGNRHGTFATTRNLVLVMLLGGLWHGASWNFVLWGLLHGAFLGLCHGWQTLWNRSSMAPLPPTVGWGLTMLVVVLAWVPFRAPDFATSLAIWQSMAGLDGLGYETAKTTAGHLDKLYLVVFPVGFLAATLLPNTYEITARYRPVLNEPEANWSLLSIRWHPTAAWGLALSLCFLAAILSQTETVEFLYFQF
jgi:D-alanyl-lipoteichoic acid acyltransferase DltB (MBOAT superfamily)